MEHAEITPESMHALLGERFEVVDHECILELVAVNDDSQPGSGLLVFSLLFKGDWEFPLAQGAQTLRRGDDVTELFVVPIAGDPALGPRYEAAFTRFVEADVSVTTDGDGLTATH